MTVNKITKAPTQNEIINSINDLIDNKQDTLIAGTDLEIIPAGLPILPEGFTQIEYIEGTGTQYIDTGFYGTQNSGAYIKFALTDLTSEGSARVFGTRNGTAGTKAFAFISSYDGSSLPSDKFYIGSNGYASWPTNLDTNWHEVSCNIENDKKVYFDGNLIITGGNTAYTSTAQASIFRRYNQNTYSGKSATAKMSILQIYENAVMVHNFIPCRRDSDDEIGMYDLVSDTFFTNSGTGTFIAGPDTVFPEADLINFTNESGYIKGIDSTDVITALGYTPYDSANPDGYTSNEGTVTSVNNTQPDANGDVTLTIPTVNDGILTITQNGTSKGTFSANQSTNDTIALTDTTYNAFTGADGTNAGSSGLVPAPSATDNDKYLKGDGTWASVSGGSSTDVQINGTSITNQGVANIVTNTAYNASSNKIATMSDVPSTSGLANTDLSNLTATGEAHFLKNTATGSNSLTIIGNATSGTQNVNIGKGSTISASGGGVAVGYGATIGQNATYSTAIGHGASVTAAGSIQLGGGVNSTSQSLAVGFTVNQTTSTYQLLNGATGLIPDARLSTNIARTSQIPSTSGLANTSLSNLSSTGKKVIDGQWVQKYLEVTTGSSTGSNEHSLSSYLPNDSYSYEVLFTLLGNTVDNSSGGTCEAALGTAASPWTNQNTCLNGQIRVSKNSTLDRNTFILPISTARKVYSQISTHAFTGFAVRAYGYRRIGTNT